MGAQIHLNSNNWSQSMINGLVFGEYIASDVIQRSINRSRVNNRFGFSSNVEVGLESDFGRSTKVYLGIADRSMAFSSLSKDMNRFLLGGNSQFAGDTIYADGSFLQLMRFQEFTLGIKRQVAGFSIAAEASILNGELLQELQVKTGRLYTDPIGSSFSYDLDISRRQSDSLRNGFLAPNGIGMGFGFFIQKQSENLFFTAGVRDLGWISWTDSSITTNYNTQEIWEANVVEIGDTQGINVNLQDTIRRFESSARKHFNTILPPIIQLALISQHGDLEHAFFGNWRLNSAFVPWIQYRLAYSVNDNLKPYAQLGSGGSGNYFIGLGGQLDFDRFQANVALTNIEGLIAPERSSGLGAALQLMMKL